MKKVACAFVLLSGFASCVVWGTSSAEDFNPFIAVFGDGKSDEDLHAYAEARAQREAQEAEIRKTNLALIQHAFAAHRKPSEKQYADNFSALKRTLKLRFPSEFHCICGRPRYTSQYILIFQAYERESEFWVCATTPGRKLSRRATDSLIFSLAEKNRMMQMPLEAPILLNESYGRKTRGLFVGFIHVTRGGQVYFEIGKAPCNEVDLYCHDVELCPTDWLITY